jgi:dyslexia susceptibility 1 candidate gene 1 protein
MDIDTKQHALMDSRRDKERKKAMDALEEWRTENGNSKMTENPIEADNDPTTERSGVKIVELHSEDEDVERECQKINMGNVKAVRVTKKETSASNTKQIVKSDYVERKKKEVADRVLPKLRERGEVEITHTPRTFPTPSRESTAMEEEAWIKNITLARRATGKHCLLFRNDVPCPL